MVEVERWRVLYPAKPRTAIQEELCLHVPGPVLGTEEQQGVRKRDP